MLRALMLFMLATLLLMRRLMPHADARARASARRLPPYAAILLAFFAATPCFCSLMLLTMLLIMFTLLMLHATRQRA